MSYQALYRKWRPLVFDDVFGQTHITTTLKNEIRSGKTAHAYLFCGTRGTGKTSCAKILSRAVNCLNPVEGNPCNQCEVCSGILDGSIMDVTEIDAASNNGVDNIRQIRDEVVYTASKTKYKVYIIDEVHMLSTGAFNALLKTLEEPPAHVIFILATTEAHKLPATIISRCQRFDFRRISQKDITIRLKQIITADNIGATDEAVELIARLADGGMRDALSILDRCVSACPAYFDVGDITAVLGIAQAEAVDSMAWAMINKNITDVLAYIQQLSDDGRDLTVFMENLTKRFRDLLICGVSIQNGSGEKNAAGDLSIYGVTDTQILQEQAKTVTMEQVSYILAVLTEAMAQNKWSKSPRIGYELALIKICSPALDTSPQALLERIAALEKAVESGVVRRAEDTSGSPETYREEKLPPAIKSEEPKTAESVKEQKQAVQESNSSQPEFGQAALAKVCVEKWAAVLDILQKSNIAIYAQLMRRRPEVSGEAVVISFKPEEECMKQIISQEKNMLSLKAAIKEVAGEEVFIKLMINGEPTGYDPLSEIENKLGSMIQFE